VALKDQLDADLQAATRDQDMVRLAVVRMLKSAIKYREIELSRPLDDQGVLQVISQEIVRHRDSVERHRAGNQRDLVAKEEAEIAVLQSWLPAQIAGR